MFVRLSILIFSLVIFGSNGINGKVVTTPKLKLYDGNEIPALGLGTWLGQGSQKNNSNPGQVERAVSWAIEAGYRHVDTAYAYGIEEEVGRAITKKLSEGLQRAELFVTTKLWNTEHARDAVVPALRGSLEKLNLDYVDLFLIHWPVGMFENQTNDLTDSLETWRGMIEAKNLGLTKSIGLSNFNQSQIQRIFDSGLEQPAVLQVELNLNLQQPELLAYCRNKNILVTAYTPFGSIFPWKAASGAPPPRVDDPELVAIAAKYNKTVPQVVLRYLVELGVVPIPKSVTKTRIEQNIDVFDFHLTQEEKALMKSYDRHYRTLPQRKWSAHPYYPFEQSLLSYEKILYLN